jgi:hypothetical protein
VRFVWPVAVEKERCVMHDLHQGFTDPAQAALGELHEFLSVADRLPEIQAYKRKFRPRGVDRGVPVGVGLSVRYGH